MSEFYEYIRQGEPQQVEKARIWQTAIGLQDVDVLNPSQYLLDTAKRHIEGELTIDEVKGLIDTYYKSIENRLSSEEERTEEADKVSARITELLQEETFSFTPAEYQRIHRRLFQGIFKFAGKYRTYNISKKEWVLDGDTVLYNPFENISKTLYHDFAEERKFLRNMVLGENNELKDRYLHLSAQSVNTAVSKGQFDTLNVTFGERAGHIRKSPRTVKRIMASLSEKHIIARKNGKRDGWREVLKSKAFFAIILVGSLFLTGKTHAQDLTSNAEYNARMDSLNKARRGIYEEWNATIPPHFMEAMRLEKEAESHPELKDSLLAISARERKTGQDLQAAFQERLNKNMAEQQALSDKYALVFEDAFPYYRTRKLFSKDSLSVVLNKSSQEIRRSAAGKALRQYIKTSQIVEGEPFRKFRCYDADGKRFDWSLTKGKKVFLIHDGLWCMTHGTDNSALRKFLQHLSETSPNCLPLVVVNCADKEGLLAAIEEYGLRDFHVVSEFKKDRGVLNWLYNDTTTPTCHHIDERGILVKTTEGVNQEYLEQEFLRIK